MVVTAPVASLKTRAPLRRPPREERDLMIAAANGWVVGYDNLSGIPVLLSDAICTLATGAGFSTRELYTDADEKLFDATRPVLLNGIDDLATHGDLLDRCLCLTLTPIDDELRLEEEELWPRFEEVRSRPVLGALLDAVVMALHKRARSGWPASRAWLTLPPGPWPPSLRAGVAGRRVSEDLHCESRQSQQLGYRRSGARRADHRPNRGRTRLVRDRW